jgi:hypothetical protein
MFVFEDNFDFKTELLKDDEDINKCLISGDLLENPIKLTCGHEFNYEPLFKEVFNQKINPQFKNDVQLKIHQFKCPYCRKIQNALLPDNKVKIYKVTTNDSDYEVYPFMFLDGRYELGTCNVPYCTKKYVCHKKPYKINVCCVHEKLNKKEMLNISKINKYLEMYPDVSIANIIKMTMNTELTAKEKEEAAKLKELKLKEKEEKAAALLKEKEDKAKAKELKLKAKEEKATALLKAKEDKAKAKELKLKEKEDKAKAKELKLKAKEDKAKENAKIKA